MNKITQHEKGWGWNGDVCAVFGVAIVIGATGEDPAKDRSEKESKAELIAEAFNVATETGLTPRQLAEQRAELVEALKDCVGYMEASAERDLNDWQTLEPTKRKAKEKLERAKKYRSIIATSTLLYGVI